MGWSLEYEILYHVTLLSTHVMNMKWEMVPSACFQIWFLTKTSKTLFSAALDEILGRGTNKQNSSSSIYLSQ